MDSILTDQIRYYEIRIADCSVRPELHGRQIAAYQRLLAMARAAADTAGFYREMQATGTAMEIARAEWGDRYEGALRIHRALGDDRKARADELCSAAASESGDGDFAIRTGMARAGSIGLTMAAEASERTIPLLFNAVLDWHVEASSEARSDRADWVRTVWLMLRGQDPGCSWQRICEHPPYRNRLPFDDVRLRTIGGWLATCLGAPPDDVGPVEAPPPAGSFVLPPPPPGPPLQVPSAAEVAAGYHVALAGLDAADPAAPGSRELYHRIFTIEATSASGPGFLRALAEEDLPARLVRVPQLELARRGLLHAAGMSQLHAEHHYRALIACLEQSRTPTEIEVELIRHSEAYAVETAWNEVLLHYALKAILAVVGYEALRTETQRETARRSYRAVCELFGRGWDALLDTPRIWDFFARALFGRGQRVTPAPDAAVNGSQLGEVGLAAIQEVRQAAAWFAADQAARLGAEIDGATDAADEIEKRVQRLLERPRFASAEAMRAHLTELFQDIEGGHARPAPGPPSYQELVFWGRCVHLDDLVEALLHPRRPQLL
jgi:hypothetical protein